MMHTRPEQTLSDLLRTMRDQFRGHEIVDGQVVISGDALRQLVETLDHATAAAERLEADLANARSGGTVVPFPRHPRHVVERVRPRLSRHRRHDPWQPAHTHVPGMVHGDDEDDGGSAA